MSRNKKDVEDVSAPVEGEETVAVVVKPKIPFAIWFDKQVKAGKIRDYQDEALLVFFKKKGLKSSEDVDTYTKAFESF